MTAHTAPGITTIIDLANRIEPYLDNLLWAIAHDLGCEEDEERTINSTLDDLRKVIIRGYRNQAFDDREQQSAWEAVQYGRDTLSRWDITVTPADRAAIWSELEPANGDSERRILTTLNAPWHGMYEAREDGSVAVIRDSGLRHLAYSPVVAKAEASSGSGPTLDTFWLMRKTPQFLAALVGLIDAIGDTPLTMKESVREAVYQARAVVAEEG